MPAYLQANSETKILAPRFQGEGKGAVLSGTGLERRSSAKRWIRRRDRYCRNTLANPKPEPYLAAFPAGDIRVDPTSEHFLNLLVYERAWALCHDEHL
jgi:hypothetical protein